MKHLNRSIQVAEAVALGAMSRFAPGEQMKKAMRRAWAKKLVGLRGVPLKFSQILAITRNEENAAIQKEALAQLEPLPIEDIKVYLQTSAPDLWEQIESIEEKGIPASLGQVHQVRLKNGQICALKVKYPMIEHNMDLDETLMGLMTKTFNHFKEGFHLDDYQSVIKSELEGELDYPLEVERQEKLHQGFQKSSTIIIPCPIPAYSGEDHILMTWEDGIFLPEFLETASTKEKNQAAQAIKEFFMICLFELGYVHADPNLGNFAFRRDGGQIQLVVYDFGSVVPFPQKQAIILLKMMEMVDLGKGDLLPWLVELGFAKEPLSAIHNRLLPFMELLMEPILCRASYDLESWNRKERAKEILGPDRWNFMVAAPASLMLFMRAIQGLFYYSRQLSPGFYLRPLVDQYLKQYSKEIEKATASLPQHEEAKELDMAEFLKIKVTENGKIKVSLTFPRAAVENLETLIDSDVQKKLASQGIILDEIVRQCRETGYRSMELFDYQNDTKNVKVYLE